MKYCAFCGQGSNIKKITKEHIYNKSLSAHAKINSGGFSGAQRYINFAGEIKERNFSNPKGMGDMSINAICSDCNNSWINSVDNPAMKILRELTDGGAYDLCAEDVGFVYRWAVKTAMVRALQDSGENNIPESYYRSIRASGSIGNGVFVWLGKCNPKTNGFDRHSRFFLANSGGLSFTSFGIAHLAVYVLMAPSYSVLDMDFLEILRGMRSKKLIRIIDGMNGTKWPPEDSLDLFTMRAFSNIKVAKDGIIPFDY